MKRIQYDRYGGPDVMKLVEVDPPAPRKGEVLVRVKAASVNPFDWKLRQGTMKMMSGNRFPRAMGGDFSGVVEAVGPGVTRIRAGDEVVGVAPLMAGGAYGEKLVTQEKLVIKKPASLSFEAAAALPTAGVTAWRALVEKGGLKSRQAVFINGANGGVGQAATYIAKSLGTSTAGRVGPAALADAAAMGLDPVLDYTKPIPASLNQKFDIVFDCNGGLTPREGDALLRRGGKVLDINPTTSKFIRSLYSPRHGFVMGSPSQEILQKVVDLAAAGKMNLTIGRTARLDEAITLITDLEAGRRNKGKAVIVMG